MSYFQKFFKVSPDDPNLYHIMLNMDKMEPKTAADVVSDAAGDLAH